jgi:hypothetical protein
MTLERLTADDFALRRQERFALSAGGGALDLVLAEVHALGPGVNRQAFSLIFHGPLAPILPQAIYRLQNPAMGTLELFLVPLGPRGELVRYEAAFT